VFVAKSNSRAREDHAFPPLSSYFNLRFDVLHVRVAREPDSVSGSTSCEEKDKSSFIHANKLGKKKH